MKKIAWFSNRRQSSFWEVAWQLLNVFCFEPSPAYKRIFLLKWHRHFFFFFHLTFFYEHVNICIVIAYITLSKTLIFYVEFTKKLGSLSFLALGPFLGLWPWPWPPICIYQPWQPICIYQPWPPISICQPWPPPPICIYQSRSRFYYYQRYY